MARDSQELLSFVGGLIEDMRRYGVDHLELSADDLQVSLELMPEALAVELEPSVEAQRPEETPPTDEPTVEVRSIMVGVYRSMVDPSRPVILREGMRVNKGDPLGAIEGLSFVHYLKSPVSGTLKRVLVSDEDVVEYDQLLFEISPEESEELQEEQEIDGAVARLRRS